MADRPAAVPGDVLAALNSLRNAGATEGFYLAGGTNLALRFGHRLSLDLDLFHPLGFSAEDVLAKLELASVPVGVEYQDEGTLRLFVGASRTKVEFFRYRYPLIRPLEYRSGVALAHPLDVGVMKLSAIADRGSRKDFVDLFRIHQEAAPLTDVLRVVPIKFAGRIPDPYHVARSLGYFADADREPPVVLLKGPEWPAIRHWFAEQADLLLRGIEAGRNPW